MKNLIINVLFACSIGLLSNVLSAQPLKEKDMPSAVLNAYKAKFPNAKTTKCEYKKDKKEYRIDCVNDNYITEVTYSQNGKWIKTEKDISEEELPKTVIDSYVKSKYAKGNISKVKEISRYDSKDKEYKFKVDTGNTKYQLKYSASGKLLKAEEKKKQAK